MAGQGLERREVLRILAIAGAASGTVVFDPDRLEALDGRLVEIGKLKRVESVISISVLGASFEWRVAGSK